ncbi:hypothetical protein ACTFBT_16060 [Streptomyces microflavus]|uniref:hypothetical protein n=1 Tax=Streptomyces TaxID=1883 RepID=UPI0029B9D18C|nr:MULTISPECIES: hypothetical protein [Streptomyces]MDX2981200.1 hypothetical protein [Streptomyces sp. NRRL_B-2249]
MVSLPPPRTTELYYGGAWHTTKAREADPVTIERGVSAEGTTAGPSAATQTLDNTAGDLSPRDPSSPLHGAIGRNTPWRFSIDAGGPWLNLPGSGNNGLTTPNHANLAITGDIDIRLDVALDGYREETHLAGRYETTGNQRSWLLSLVPNGLRFIWSPDGTFTNIVTATSTAPVPAYSGQRLCLRVTLDVNNGSGGKTVTFYTGQQLTGRWQPLGAPVTTAGTTSLYNASSEGIQLGAVPDYSGLRARGRLHRLQVRNGIDGMLAVNMDTATAADPGDTSFTDATGLVWTIRDSATLTNRHIRMAGEVPEWPPSRDLSGADRTVAIAPAGIMRRLGAGNRPLDSALRRFVIGNGPLACWPLTGGAQSQWGSSLQEAGPRMLPQGDSNKVLKWADGSVGDWMEPVLAIGAESTGALRAEVPIASDASTGWAVDWFRAGTGADTEMIITDWGVGSTGESQTQWIIFTSVDADSIGVFRITRSGDTSSAAEIGYIASAGLHDEQPHHLRFMTSVSGGNTAWVLYVDSTIGASGVQAITGKAIRSVHLGWDPTFGDVSTSDLSIGYLTYWGSLGPSVSTVGQAYRGFPGETAGARVLRLSGEHGVPVSVAGEEAAQTRLGIQRPDRYLETLDTITKADLGFLFERRDGRELAYRSRSTLYNQDPVITLNFANGVISEPFQPTDGDKLTKNDVAVTREGGATSPRAVLTTGRMSVQDPPAGVGRYDEDYTLSLEADHQTDEHAQWRMHLGTHDGLRYTKITLNLGNPRVYAMIGDIYRADVGDLIRLTNLPDDHGPDDVDLIIRGYKEEIGEKSWTITFNCTPGAPWEVGAVEDPVLGRADTDGTTLSGALNSTSGTVNILTGTGLHRWIDSATYGSMFPYDVTVGSEVMRVNSCLGTALSQTFLVTRGINGFRESHPSGTPVRLTHPMRTAL